MPETNKVLEERLRILLARVPDIDANTGVRKEMRSVIYDRLMKPPPDGPADPVDIARVEGWEAQFSATPADSPDAGRETRTEREESESLAARTEERSWPDHDPLEERLTTARHHHIGLVLVFMLVAGFLAICLYFLSRETHATKSAVQATANTAVAKADAAQATADAAQTDAANAKTEVAAVKAGLDTLKDNIESLRNTHEKDMAAVQQRFDITETIDVAQGQMLAEFRNRLDGHDRQLRDFREEANAWRDSILDRSPTAQGSSKRAPAAPVAPKVETTQVVPTSTGSTVAVTLRNTLNVKVKLAYESWNRVLVPNGQIVLNLPPGETIRLVVTNLRSGEGWVIPVDAANQREVTIPPR